MKLSFVSKILFPSTAQCLRSKSAIGKAQDGGTYSHEKRRTSRMNKDKSRKSPAPLDAHRKSALERSVKNMKMIIAGLSVALVACVVYILASPTESAPTHNGMTGSYPPATQQSVPPSAPQGTGTVPDGPANTQQVPASADPIPAPAPAASPVVPTGQNSGKINPPHGQPGHRCDISVGSALP